MQARRDFLRQVLPGSAAAAVALKTDWFDRVVTASSDGTARIWNGKGRQLALLDSLGSPLTGAVQPPGRKLLGSRILFRESAELGYQLNPAISVSALLDHISNANLGRHNMGLTSAGARLGFKF